jgi:hypothetical protein
MLDWLTFWGSKLEERKAKRVKAKLVARGYEVRERIIPDDDKYPYEAVAWYKGRIVGRGRGGSRHDALLGLAADLGIGR